MKLDLDAPATFEEEKKDGPVPMAKPHIDLKQIRDDLDDNDGVVDDEELARNLQDQYNQENDSQDDDDEEEQEQHQKRKGRGKKKGRRHRRGPDDMPVTGVSNYPENA